MKTIDRGTLQQSLNSSQKPILIEALPEKYFLDGHLPGALHLPHDAVRTLAASLLPDKAAPVVVYCASKTCQNSHIAAAQLVSLGYGDVAVYAGGKQDWVEAGLPLEREAATV
ncbi:MAG: rhodanese-like domain-containing protein [Burkholderiales bacterium]